MLAVDRQHQPVEEPPPLGCRAQEQPVHRRRQPHHAQMIAERGRRTHRLAVDAAAPAGRGVLAAGRVDAGAERGEARARPRPRRKPPRSRRPGCRRRRPAWRAAGRGPATETRSPPGNWSCRRRSARPAPRHRRAPASSPRDNCGSASASGDGCGRGSCYFVMARSCARLPSAAQDGRRESPVRRLCAICWVYRFVTPASASARRARPCCPCPAPASASRDRPAGAPRPRLRSGRRCRADSAS